MSLYKNISEELADFCIDKANILDYIKKLDSKNQTKLLSQSELEHIFSIERKWRSYPLLNRTLTPYLKEISAKRTNAFDIKTEIYSENSIPHSSPQAVLLTSPSPIPTPITTPITMVTKDNYNAISTHSTNISPKIKDQAIYSKLKLSTPQAHAERKQIQAQDHIFTEALEDLLEHRLEETIAFGKQCSIGSIATYLKSQFGDSLFFDSLLSLTQQYALADVPLVNEHGNSIGKTGFHLAYCGDPGTGKTFSIKDLILGNSNLGVMAHGLKGRNRYCGSITPAKFVRIAEAYQDQRFNFIVPEFDDWFRYKGMTNTLKTALEGGLVEYETFRESIGPYNFSSFFSVNYNVKVTGESYDTLIKDPHFKALEDRMLLTVHRLTPERYRAVAKAKEQLEKGLMDWTLAPALQDLAMLTYAIQTAHPSIDNYVKKAVMVPASFYEQLNQVRENLMTAVEETSSIIKSDGRMAGEKDIPFIPRLEKKVLQLAGAFSLPSYFQNDSLVLQMSEDAISYAFVHLAQEAIARGRLQVSCEELLG